MLPTIMQKKSNKAFASAAKKHTSDQSLLLILISNLLGPIVLYSAPFLKIILVWMHWHAQFASNVDLQVGSPRFPPAGQRRDLIAFDDESKVSAKAAFPGPHLLYSVEFRRVDDAISSSAQLPGHFIEQRDVQIFHT